MAQKDDFNSFIPAMLTIFSSANSPWVARRWVAKDIRSLSCHQRAPLTLSTGLVFSRQNKGKKCIIVNIYFDFGQLLLIFIRQRTGPIVNPSADWEVGERQELIPDQPSPVVTDWWWFKAQRALKTTAGVWNQFSSSGNVNFLWKHDTLNRGGYYFFSQIWLVSL